MSYYLSSRKNQRKSSTGTKSGSTQVTSTTTTRGKPGSQPASPAWNIEDVTSRVGLNRLGNVVEQLSSTAELDAMEKAVRQKAREHYGASTRWPPSVRTLLNAIEKRDTAVRTSAATKTVLNKTKQVHQVAPPVNLGVSPNLLGSPPVNLGVPPSLPGSPPVNQGPPNLAIAVPSSPPTTAVRQAAAVVANVTAGELKGTYNLRDQAARAKFISGIASTKTDLWLNKYEATFAAAVSGLPNAESEFADVRKAFADRATDLAKPPPPAATTVQLAGYKDLTEWSKKSVLPLYGSTLMKRVELASVPSRSGEEADQQSRNYTLNLTIPQRLQSDRAVAVATHIANSLHADNIHGANLRQVVKIKDGTNELYHLNIHIPKNSGSPTDPPARIDVTLDTVKGDNPAVGKAVGFHELDAGLSGRILQIQGSMALHADYNAKESPKPLDIRSKEWLTTETELLKRAVGLIPQKHWSLLSNLKFIRVDKLPGGGDNPAEYFPTDPPVICISDKVVDPNYNEYLYDEKSDEVLPKAVRMIIHEVGHAMSLEKWRQSALKYRRDAVNTTAELNSLGGSRSMDATPIAALDKFVARGEYVTDYAASEELAPARNRDGARAELFAEAYSLWLTNPGYMRDNHKELADWFAAQEF